MKYVEKYNCFIDDDCVIYAYGTGKKHPVGKLYQPKISLSASGYDDYKLYRHNKYMANQEAFVLAAREYRRKRHEHE